MTALGQRRSATSLREEFDRGFALPHPSQVAGQLDLVLIGVGGHGYALLLPQLLALHVDRKLTEAPSSQPELLGLVALRAAITPVYDLSRLLGHGPATAPRWLVQVRAPRALAVAFEHFERHLRVPAADFAAGAVDSANALAHASGSVKTPRGPVTTLDLVALFESSTRARATRGRGEERP